MMLVSVISWQRSRFNSCSPVQLVDIEMMLASVIWSQPSRFNSCSPVQWVDSEMMLVSVIWSQPSKFNECSPVQWVDSDMHLLSENNLQLSTTANYNNAQIWVWNQHLLFLYNVWEIVIAAQYNTLLTTAMYDQWLEAWVLNNHEFRSITIMDSELK